MNALEKDAAEGKRELAAIAAAVERDIGAVDFILAYIYYLWLHRVMH